MNFDLRCAGVCFKQYIQEDFFYDWNNNNRL